MKCCGVISWTDWSSANAGIWFLPLSAGLYNYKNFEYRLELTFRVETRASGAGFVLQKNPWRCPRRLCAWSNHWQCLPRRMPSKSWWNNDSCINVIYYYLRFLVSTPFSCHFLGNSLSDGIDFALQSLPLLQLQQTRARRLWSSFSQVNILKNQ